MQAFSRLVAASAIVLAVLGCDSKVPTVPPNVVILLADDLGWNDVGYHGGSIATPRIDRFASESLVLERFYVSPECAATRGGLMTGLYPHRIGLPFEPETIVIPFLSAEARLIGQWLASVGYGERALIGKWGLRPGHPLKRGFTKFYGLLGGSVGYFDHHALGGALDWHRDLELCYDEGYATDLIADESIAFIEAPHDDPFMLIVAFNAPHLPLQAKPEVLAALAAGRAQTEANGPLVESARDHEEIYTAMVMTLDTAIGRVLDAIDDAGLRRDTLVLFASDNGAFERGLGDNGPLRGRKNTLFEGGIRVPAAIRWPARLPRGRSEVLASWVDVVPTLLQAAGADARETDFDGIGLIDMLAGDVESPDRVLYLGPRSALTSRWKLLDGELFDLSRDPGERKDVAAENRDVVTRLQQQLEAIGARRPGAI